MSFQAYLDNVEEKTGKTPNDFIVEAKKKNIKGRSTMTKAQLQKAVGRD